MTDGYGELIVINADQQGNSFILSKPHITIGSADTNDVIIEWPGVSGTHCAIESSSFGCYILDLDSKKGTIVNNRRVKKANLAYGDIIKLGRGQLRYESATFSTDSASTMLEEIEAATDSSMVGPGRLVSSPKYETRHPEARKSHTGQIIGRYEIKALAGPRDPFLVYRAQDPQLNREVAVKIMAPHFAENEAYRKRVQGEVALIAALEHPNIVQVYDFGEYQGQPYIVMPFLTDGTLAAHLKGAPLTLAQLTPLVARIAEALDVAHSQGVIHRQLRPENILLDAHGQAYLSDFGVSSTADMAATIVNQELSQAMVKYMSPEAVQALQSGAEAMLTSASDIYALGLIVFEALTGQHPFQHEAPYDAATAHLTQAIPQLRTVNPTLPTLYQSLIDQTLVINPDDRLVTATELANRMNDLVAGRPDAPQIIQHQVNVSVEQAIKQPQPIIPHSIEPLSAPRSYLKIGRYQVERQLGRGGMAQVHLAHDPQISRQVAIKVMSHRQLKKASFRERFHHEAQLVANLNNNAIVTVYDYGEHQGQPFIVMQYLPGGTLADKLADASPNLSILGPMFARLADALDTAHAHNIVHQDVKPGNILFDADNQVFLSDFGIASLFDANSDVKADRFISGTPAYMSPEQAQAIIDKTPAVLDGRSDIYSLGIVLFKILTGQVPYKADQPRQTIQAHITEPIPRISKFASQLPAAFQDVVDKAMAKDPNNRYQTAKAFATEIEELAARLRLAH